MPATSVSTRKRQKLSQEKRDEIVLQPPRLEDLTPTEEGEVVRLLALLFVATARRRRDATEVSRRAA